ncbi:PAS domain-containing protein [Candidatus Micrarchaeota archaeon]|nr:PAS domain-containing protein [Candidatus Micrarchaeota archaeon]
MVPVEGFIKNRCKGLKTMKLKDRETADTESSGIHLIDTSFMEDTGNPTETIDLNSLFEPDVSVSGAYDLREVKATSFGKLLEAVPIPSMLLDWDGYVGFSNSACILMAPDPQDLVGLHMTHLVEDEESRVFVEEALEQVCVSRKPKVLEAGLGVDPKRIWARISFRSMRIGKDRSILALVEDLTLERRRILLDKKHKEELEQKVQSRTAELSRAVSLLKSEIEDRKLAQARSRSAARELRRLIDTANAPIIGIDAGGKINEWNQKAENITGYKLSEAQGRDLVNEFIARDHADSVSEVLEKALNGTGSENFEAPLITCDGKRVMALMSATPRTDDQDNIIGVVGVGQDVTDLIAHRAELERMVEVRTKELRKSLEDTANAKDRIDGILKSVADGLIVTDNQNAVILMNKAAEALLGVKLQEVKRRSLGSLVDDERLRNKLISNLESSRRVSEFDCPLPDPRGGKLRIFRARTSSISDQEGKKRGMVTIFRDVTREREVDRLKTEFISTAAHELRTPLTSILGFSELLVNDDSVEDQDKVVYLTYINEQSHKLAKIIDELLDISRIESGKGFKLSKAPIMAPEFVLCLSRIIEETYPEHNFIFQSHGEAVEFYGDKTKLEQAIFNIVSNSAKYSKAGTDITLTCSTAADKISLTVSDQGRGMTPDQVEQIFDKFYRGEYSNTGAEGVGLGMTIVKHLVDAHGGRVLATSEPGKGTDVTVSIPVDSKWKETVRK